MYQNIIPELISLLLLVGLGIAVKAGGFVNETLEKGLAEFILYLVIPAMVVVSLHDAQAAPAGFAWSKIMFMTGLTYAFSAVFAWAASRFLHRDPTVKKTLRFLMSFNNVGNIAYPIIGVAYGVTGVIYVTVFNLFFNVLFWTLGVWILRDESAAFRPRKLFSPVLGAIAAGYLIYLFRIPLPDPVYSALFKLSQTLAPAAMLLIGCSLAALTPAKIFLDALLWKIILLKQAALPLVFFGLMRLFVDDRETLSITTLMIAMPSAVSNVAFIKSSGADASLAARVVVSTTCAALPLLGFFLWLTTL